MTSRDFKAKLTPSLLTPRLWCKLPPILRVPYQSGASSSPSYSPSSGSDPGRMLAFLVHALSTLILNLPFLEVFPCIAIYPVLGMI